MKHIKNTLRSEGEIRYTVYGNKKINFFQNQLDHNNYLNVRCRCEVNEVAEYVNYFFPFHSIEERNMIHRELQDIIDYCDFVNEGGVLDE